MEGQWFELEENELIKHEYEKELLLGLLEAFERRME
jgi:hypothetical protein